MPRQPPVEEIQEGLWSIPVVIPGNPLGYTLVYLFVTDSGPVLVDNGWNDPQAWQALVAGVTATAHDITDVYGVLLTHIHPDHHGLSQQVRDASGAWVAMHPEDAWAVSRVREFGEAWHLQAAAQLLHAGADESDLGNLPHPDDIRVPAAPSLPTRLFSDGEHVDVPGWTVRAIWTPGHSPGHCCFAVEGSGLLLSGDHVLPRISPHIGLSSEDNDFDPLGDYLASLQRLYEEDDVRQVLPAHLHRFDDLGARLRELTEHHHERLAEIEAVLAKGSATLWEITAAMPWSREWDEIPAGMKRAALAEALAHLRYLEKRHRVERVDGTSPATYQLRAPVDGG